MEKQLEYRMYGLVPYNLSPIQQGIQYGHAVQEFNNRIIDDFIFPGGDCTLELTYVAKAFKKWRKEDKTFIILNGGTTNLGEYTGVYGTLNSHCDELRNAGVEVSTFHEPDLGDQLTAVVFLVDERVFNKKDYPDFFDYVEKQDKGFQMMWQSDQYHLWVDFVGGEKNVWLREFLSQFRLA